MDLYFGIIIGLIIATLIFVVLAFFRVGIERRVKIIEKQLYQAGPKPKGHIFLPEDEQDIIRKKKIEENDRRGIDTPIDDLR